jgi:hypothetical protein
MSSLNVNLNSNAFDMSVTSLVHLLSRRFNLGPQGADCREENIRVSCYLGSRAHPPVMPRCPVLFCPPANHIAPSASFLLSSSSNYLPVRDVAVCDCRQGRISKPEIKCRSEATIVEAGLTARVLALYVLSGARGGTGRAINAFSVSVRFQISCWLAGVSEHEKKIASRDFADVPAYDVLVKVSCAIEHISHVFDIRDIPTPNILVEDFCLTAFNSRPSGDVRDEICMCVCEC